MPNKVADVTIYHECPDGTYGYAGWSELPHRGWMCNLRGVSFCENCGQELEPVLYEDVLQAANEAANK